MSSRLRNVLCGFFLLSVSASGVTTAGEPCKIATKGDTPTAKACAKGGRSEATKLMKEMVRKAKGNGAKFDCDSCHKDRDTFELTKNAEADYKKLEAAAAKK